MPPKRQSSRKQRSGPSKKQLNRVLRGFSFLPPEQPRMVHNSPWWAVTCSVAATSDTKITVNSICNSLRDQLGLYKTDASHRIDIAIRIKRASVYCLSTGRPIGVCFHGMTSTDFNTVLEDWPSQTALARVGYEWPIADQTFVSDDASTRTVFSVDVRAESTWLAFLQVLWRPTVQSKIALSDIYEQIQSMSASSSILHL
jgi:hypothetical protein